MPNTTDLDLVVEALRARAEQRQRAGTLLSTKLAEQRAGGSDVRAGAVKVIDELDAANRLGQLADQLETGATRLAGGGPFKVAPVTIPRAVAESNPASVVDAQKAAIVFAGDERTGPSEPTEEEIAAAIALVQAADEGVDGKLEDVDGLEIDVLDGDDNRGASDVAAALAVLDAADVGLAASEAGV